MKNIIQILINVSIFVFSSCSLSVKNQNTLISPISSNENLLIIDMDKANEVDNILYSSLFKAPKTIILETNDNCLIKSTGGVQVYQNRIYLLDKENRNLFVYDMNGSFIQTIGSAGNGPGEFVDIADFTIDTQNNIIFLLDDYTYSIHKYDAVSGKFIGKIKMEANNTQTSVIQYVSGNIYVNSLPANESSEKYLLVKINPVNGEREAVYLDADKYNKGSNFQLRNPSSFFYSRNTDSPKYIDMFMDTIVSISEDKIAPFLAVKSKHFVTKKDMEEANKTYWENGISGYSSIIGRGKIFVTIQRQK